MAALAADIATVFNPAYPIGLAQFAPVGTDIYYRGGLSYTVGASGLLTLTPAVTADFYAGVVMEHKSATTADLIWVATSGIWNFLCANLTNANRGKVFAAASTDLFDNPATLDVSGTGDVAACGTLNVVTETAVSGWLDTNARITAENL
jgi:hypothetical protein